MDFQFAGAWREYFAAGSRDGAKDALWRGMRPASRVLLKPVCPSFEARSAVFAMSNYCTYKYLLRFPAKGIRSKAIGRLADGTIVVIFVTLGTEAISVISMRPAGKAERNLI